MKNHSAIPRRYWNGRIWVETQEAVLESDPETGNLLPKKSIVECQVFVKEDSLRPTVSTQPGQGIQEIAVIIRMAMPTRLPVSPPLNKVKMEYNKQMGWLRIPVGIQSSCEQQIQERIAGQKLKGYFAIQG
ncbi:MAG TPA: hypothetical protein DCY88_07805 [Cyanobacteria bacterium UBA11372]|nr:hypothetical protein [Cyanobacteria bacterium UBA11372]